MRLATYNVENMFERPAVMNLSDWSKGRKVLEDFTKLNDLVARDTYTASIKTQLLDIMKGNKGLVTKGTSSYIRLRETGGKLIGKVGNDYQVKPGGRGDWVGWFELVPDQINDAATLNTGRVVKLLNADVLCVVEADNRTALTRFNSSVVKKAGGVPYDHVMLIDGNDERGIDVGILTRQGLAINGIQTHVDDVDAAGQIFSRDCAEYRLNVTGIGDLLVLVNHFRSKGYGAKGSADEKRRRQAERVRQIYDRRRAEGADLVAVVGDLNDTPDSAPLEALVKKGSDLVDVMTHAKFVGDGRPGTFGTGAKAGKFDYILMSPALAARVTTAGIERRGVWGGTQGTLFPHLAEITKEIEAASDHAALWVDFQ